MPVLSTGKNFSATEQITSTKLNNIANAADFTDTSGNAVDSASSTGTCVNGGGIEVTTSGQLQIKDTEVTTAKIGTNAVTLAKMATQADQTVLGNISGGAAVPSALPVVIGGSGDSGILFDNDDMLDNSDTAGGSATRGATQQSIKAYVELFKPNIVQDTDTVSRTFDGSSSTDFLDTQLSVSITPKFSNSKFLITCTISSSTSNADYPAYFRVLRDSSVVTGSVNTDTVGSNHVKMMFGSGGNANQVSNNGSFTFLDNVASGGTSAITYKVQIAARDGQEVHMNRTRNFTDSNDQASGISSLIVQEIYQ